MHLSELIFMLLHSSLNSSLSKRYLITAFERTVTWGKVLPGALAALKTLTMAAWSSLTTRSHVSAVEYSCAIIAPTKTKVPIEPNFHFNYSNFNDSNWAL